MNQIQKTQLLNENKDYIISERKLGNKTTAQLGAEFGVGRKAIERNYKKWTTCVPTNEVSPKTRKRSTPPDLRDSKQQELYNTLSNLDSPETLYLLGVLLADGCLHTSTPYKGTGRVYHNLSLSMVDKEPIELMSKVFGSNISVTKLSEKNPNWRDQLRTRYSVGPRLANLLRSYGVSERKTWDKGTVPDELLLNSHFLRGFMDGDGSYNISKRNGGKGWNVYVGTTTVIEGFADQLCTTFEKISGDGKKHRKKNLTHEIRITINESIKKFLLYVYENSTPETRIDRKYKKAQEILNHIDRV